MSFRKRNAKRKDNKASAAVIMGKPSKQLTKEEKKILSARMAEIRNESKKNSIIAEGNRIATSELPATASLGTDDVGAVANIMGGE